MKTIRPSNKEPNTIYFLFNYKDKTLKKGELSYVTLYWYHSRRIERYRKLFKCTTEQWNVNKCRVTTKHKDYLRLNNLLINIEKGYSSLLFKLQEQGEQITAEIFQDFYLEVTNQNIKQTSDELPKNFNDYIKSEIEEERKIGKLKSSTIESEYLTLFHLNKFNKNIGLNDLETLPKDFEVYLRAEGMAERSTIPKHQKTLKKFLVKYIDLGLKKNFIISDINPYKDYKVSRIKGDRVELTLEEVDKIASLDMEPGSLMDISRDRFLFSCETGLRLSDNMNLNTSHLQVSDLDGVSIRMNRMIKVDYELNLNLRQLFNGRPEQILLKYISIDEIRKAHKNNEVRPVFPEMSEDTIRNRLRVIKGLAGINKAITFHSSRHTFGTNLADTGAGVDLIMELMGISNPNTVRVYIHRSSERRKRKLAQLNWNVHKQEANEDESSLKEE